jgi:hypothetical protein
MDYLLKSIPSAPDRADEPLVGERVADTFQIGTDDLSDFIEVMEAVEALCPVWPVQVGRPGGRYLL